MTDPVPRRVLLVEDETSIADTLIFALVRDGFTVVWHRLCVDAERAFREDGADFVILDVGLPDGSGFDFCRRLRTHSTVPVLFLTARGDEVDRIVGLEIGADDYVVKPFSPREVAARVRTILRRIQPVENAGGDGWSINEARLRAGYRGIELPLTLSEFRLLAVLHGARGRVLSRARLLDALGDAAEDTSERTIDSHVRSLRAKLRDAVPGDDPLETHRGSGYSLRGT